MERFKESRLVFPLHHRMTMTGHYWQNMLWQTLWTWYCHFMMITERLNQSEVRSKLPSDTKLLPIFKTIQPGCRFIIAPQVFFLPTNCQLGPWDLRLSPPNLQQTWNLLDSALLSRRRRHMAKLRITGFLLVFPPTDDNLIKSQMVSGLLQSDHPPAISVIVATGSSDKQGWVISYL